MTLLKPIHEITLYVFLLEMFWSCNPFKVMGLLLVLSPQSALSFLSAERSSSSLPLVFLTFPNEAALDEQVERLLSSPAHQSEHGPFKGLQCIKKLWGREGGGGIGQLPDNVIYQGIYTRGGKLLFIPLQLMEHVKKGKRCEANALCKHFCILLGMCIESGSEKKRQINDCLCKESNQYIWQN